jgi:hypothetical protein
VPVILATTENINRRIIVQDSPSKKQDPISKRIKVKRSGGMVQVREHLPSECKVLSSNPSTVKRKKKKETL